MDKDERIIEEQFGRENHFTVPEGYFDNFATQLMSQLPEQEARVIKMEPSFWRRHRYAAIAAASAVIAIFSVGIYFNGSDAEPSAASHVAHVENSNYSGSLDAAANYSMLDNEDIYACLSTEE